MLHCDFALTLQKLLGCTWQIGIQDGRIFVGTLVCTDREKNIILSNADEYRQGQQGGRFVGMILIPWKHVTKAEVDLVAYVNATTQEDDSSLYT